MMRRLFFTLTTILVLTGCASFRHLLGMVAEKPQLKLQQVELQSFTVNRIEMLFILDVFNPNSFSLDISRLDYSVRSLGMDLGTGHLDEPFALMAKEHSTVRVPFTVDPELGLKLVKTYFSNPKELKLQLDANFQIDTAFGQMDLRFSDEKTVLKGLGGS